MDSENAEPATQTNESSCTACGKSPPSTFGLCSECMAGQVRLSNEIIAEIIAEERGLEVHHKDRFQKVTHRLWSWEVVA